MLGCKTYGLVVATFLLVATPVLAEQPAPVPPMASPMPTVNAPPTMSEMLEERLAALKVGLKITSKQESLWEDLSKTALANAKAIEDLSKPDPKNPTVSPTGMRGIPDELAAREKAAKVHFENIKKLKEAIDPLYKALSDEQKRTADQRLTMELSNAM